MGIQVRGGASEWLWVKRVRADRGMESGLDQNPQNGEKDGMQVGDGGKGEEES